MAILVVGGILVGTVLGQFFKYAVLIPACGLAVILVLANPAHIEHSLLDSFLQIVAATASLQFGYVVGLVAGNFRRASKHSKNLVAHSLDEAPSGRSESRDKGAA